MTPSTPEGDQLAIARLRSAIPQEGREWYTLGQSSAALDGGSYNAYVYSGWRRRGWVELVGRSYVGITTSQLRWRLTDAGARALGMQVDSQ